MAQSNGLIDILPPDWICRPNIRGMNQPADRPHFLIKCRFHYETISRCHIDFTFILILYDVEASGVFVTLASCSTGRRFDSFHNSAIL